MMLNISSDSDYRDTHQSRLPRRRVEQDEVFQGGLLGFTDARASPVQETVQRISDSHLALPVFPVYCHVYRCPLDFWVAFRWVTEYLHGNVMCDWAIRVEISGKTMCTRPCGTAGIRYHGHEGRLHT